jgi:SNF family Na+-dependent transporter
MLDKLIKDAALVLVIVPQNPNSKEIVAALTSSINSSKYESTMEQNNNTTIDKETVAVITAAASFILGKAFQIRKIKFVKDQADTSWSRIGKLKLFSSQE